MASFASSDAPPIAEESSPHAPHIDDDIEEVFAPLELEINTSESEKLDHELPSTQENLPFEDRSLVADLHSHLQDQDIADVTLVGTDCETVLAVRSILAMRSNYFKTLFFSSFQESSVRQVKLGYSSKVIKAVVEYCYTDEIKTAFENLSFEETARSMVGLVAAGNYFELQGLQSRAYRLTCLMMDEYPALACTVLDAVSINNETSELGRVALGIIRLRTESSLLPPDTHGGVQSLGAAAMEQVLADTEIQTYELSLFMCLKKWAEYQPTSGDEETQDRQEAARIMLAHHIDFAKIAPSVLSTTVHDSGLVPMELLLNAYRKQALQAERKGLVTGQMRCTLQESTSDGRIIVQGAGLSAVNGTYRSSTSNCNDDSTIGDPLRYSRHGTLSGFGNGAFCLQSWTLQDDSKKWFLSFVPNDNTTSTTTNALDLYSSPVLSDADPPPMQKWLSVIQGHEKIRQVQNNNKFPARRNNKHTTFESSLSGDDVLGVGDPPPICIWLPNEYASTRQQRSNT